MPIYEVRQSLTTVVGLASNHPLGITNFCQAHALSLSLLRYGWMPFEDEFSENLGGFPF